MYTLIESQEYCGEFGEILDMVEEQCEFSTYKLMETYKKRPYIISLLNEDSDFY